MDHYDSDVKKFFYIINLLNKNVSMKNVEDDIVLKYSKTISAIGIVRNRKGYKNGMMTFKKIGWLYQKM